MFLGRRRAALRAAERMGVEVVRAARPETWGDLAARLPEPERVAAVLGLTEASVVPAARVRASLGLPGLDVETARRCTDKLRMKQAIRAAGLPCADFLACDRGTPREALLDALGLPLVIKPRESSGARGLRVVREARELTDPLPDHSLAERMLFGVEMSVESLVEGGEIAFSNPTEYLVVREANLVPAALPAELAEEVAALNRAAIAALGVNQGMTHLELFLTPEGPVFGELAARPPGGHVMSLIELAYGFDPWLAWLRVHLGEPAGATREARRAAGAWVLHPGAGRLRALHGCERARSLPGVAHLRVRVEPGDRIPPRLGAGQEIGHLLVVGSDRDQACARLRAARDALVFELEASAAKPRAE